MIQITDKLWVGEAAAAFDVDVFGLMGIGAVLNVAQDLRGWTGWPQVEYMQVGLIDGPGNTLAAYHAAVLALAVLLQRGYKVLVCCHEGGRAMAVVLMYMNATAGRGWDKWLEIIQNRGDIGKAMPHEAHRQAYNKINWRLLVSALGD